MKSEIFFYTSFMQSFFFKLSVIHMFESKDLVIELGEERALNCLTLQVYKSTGLFKYIHNSCTLL